MQPIPTDLGPTPSGKSLLSALRFLGISHREFNVDVRSRYALTAGQIEELHSSLREVTGVQGCLVLSTCNRTEFILDGGDIDGIKALLSEYYSLDRAELEQHLRVATGWSVVKHIFRLASGLESLVLGETQIVSQIKSSVKISEGAGSLSPLLAKVYQGAFKAGKRVRRQTALSNGSASVSHTALIMARDYLGSLRERSALVVGTGSMGRSVVHNLREKGLADVAVTNRTRQSAEDFAREVNGTLIPWEQLGAALAGRDIIIACTSAGKTIITDAMLPPDSTRQQLYLDLSVPPNIEPALANRPGVRRIDLDYIQAHIDSLMVTREEEVPVAEALVAEELLNFHYRQILDIASPAIAQLHSEYETIRQEELQRFNLNGEEHLRAMLETFSQRLVKRLAVRPLEIFRQQVEASTRSLDGDPESNA